MLFSNLCTKGFGACTKGENNVRRCDPLALEKNSFFQSVVVVVLLFKCCSSQDEKCGKRLSKRNCGGRHYFLTPQLARAAELPVVSIVCRVHWDEIRRETTGVRLLRKTTLELSTKTGYLLDFMPCWTLLERQVMFLIVREQGAATNVLPENVDQEEKFTTHAEYKPKEAQFRFWVLHNF